VPKPDRSPTGKHWYKISVDTLRMWGFLGALGVLALLSIWGYSFAQGRYLSHRVESALEEGRDLLRELKDEPSLVNFRVEYSKARDSLQRSQESLIEGDVSSALTDAEFGRTLLRSILDNLRNRSPVGAAQFIAVHGGVEFRRGGQGEWLPARGRVVLYPGDYVKTAGGGSAEVMTVEGTLFTVRPDTVLLMDRAEQGSSDSGERTFALESGWVNLSTSQVASRVTTPDAEARIEQRSQASVSYDAERRLAHFTSVQGALEVRSRDGSRRRLGERERVQQRDATLAATQTLPPSPITVSPGDNLEVFLSENDRLALNWQPVRGAVSYALQVSRNRLFVDNIIDVDGRKKTQATLGLRAEGSFVWRVAATDTQGLQSPWSPPKRFRISGQRTLGRASGAAERTRGEAGESIPSSL
jgi:hypothetical protein